MKKETKKEIIKAIGYIIVGLIILAIFIGVIYALEIGRRTNVNHTKCIEQYPLDSCELYKCRADNTNTITSFKFNMRNYEMCKIILNKNIGFNESLDLLNTITYDTTR